jgi:hypothetical protein
MRRCIRTRWPEEKSGNSVGLRLFLKMPIYMVRIYAQNYSGGQIFAGS